MQIPRSRERGYLTYIGMRVRDTGGFILHGSIRPVPGGVS
jgi:hypothetical protein